MSAGLNKYTFIIYITVYARLCVFVFKSTLILNCPSGRFLIQHSVDRWLCARTFYTRICVERVHVQTGNRSIHFLFCIIVSRIVFIHTGSLIAVYNRNNPLRSNASHRWAGAHFIFALFFFPDQTRRAIFILCLDLILYVV